MKKYDLVGQVFGRLTVLAKHTVRDSNKKVRWVCQCTCGAQTRPTTGDLMSEATTSCGCASRDHATTHGESWESRRTPEYNTWVAMRTRCRSTDTRGKYHAARGIQICDRWLSYDNFLADMGRKPSAAHSLDRIDNNGNYEPGNCRWATAKEQAANRRQPRPYKNAVVWQGKSAKSWAQEWGISHSAAIWRIRRLTAAKSLCQFRGAP